MPIVKCEICGKEIFKFPCQMNKKNFYCSRECYAKYRNTNIFITEGNITKMILTSVKYGVKEVLIDTKNLEKVKKYCWGIHYFKRQGEFYITTNIHKPKKKTLLLHRYIMDCPYDLVIDHIFHKTFDNRESQLRISTIKQNNENLLGARKDNKSTGIRGVHWNKRDKVYQVCIGHLGKNIHFGRYKNIKEAEQVAIEARKKLFTHSLECGVST